MYANDVGDFFFVSLSIQFRLQIFTRHIIAIITVLHTIIAAWKESHVYSNLVRLIKGRAGHNQGERNHQIYCM